MAGGLGDDTYVVDSLADVIIEQRGAGLDTVRAAFTYTLGAQVENLVLTGQAAVSGTGNELGNALTGNGGANTLRGLGGNDILDGGAGADVMEGGAGNDTYVVDDARDKVIELPGGGTDTIISSVSFSLGGLHVEKLVLTGSALNGSGNGLANSLTGNAGDNVLNGAGGADTMAGATGDDTYYVDEAGDRAIEAAGEGNDTVQSSVSFSLAGQDIENLVLGGDDAIDGTGNSLANSLIGNSAANVLNGGAGADTMKGRGGDDTYIVDDAGDVVVEAAGGGADTVQSSVSFSLAGTYAENVTLVGGNVIDATGNSLANTLIGNGSANALSGGEGDDRLFGRGGKDTLSGGAGADWFHFDTALGAGNVDTIRDFTAADDTIRLDRSVFSAIGEGTLAEGAFVAGTAAADADDRIVYDSATGKIFYDADGSGEGAALLFAQVTAGTALTNLDFEAYTIG
jgi:Ca2+-binding RTX toxin-like protein